MKKLILIFLLIPNICQANDWKPEDTARQTVCLIFHGTDWLQTKQIARNPAYTETNIILGKHPSQNSVDIYFLTTAIAHTAISYLLPEDYRIVWQSLFICLELGCVVHNYNAGIRIRF